VLSIPFSHRSAAGPYRMLARCARAAAVLLVLAFSAPSWAVDASVPYVPTPQSVVERMLQMAQVGPGDYLIDLGSGDGRIIVTAAQKYGARGFGVDINSQRIREANDNAQKAGVTDKVAFYQRDLFETDLSDATVITMYLLPRVNLALRDKLLNLKPGTRVVSHDFSMAEWTPDTFARLDVPDKYGGAEGQSDIYFWVIPARAAGNWQWQLPVRRKSVEYGVTLTQSYQTISGTARVAGRTARLENAKLNGEEISFTVSADIDGTPVRHEFKGKVKGNAMTGAVTLSGANVQGELDWSAERAAAAASATTTY
jgi:SAM-dependent methyltransferase